MATAWRARRKGNLIIAGIVSPPEKEGEAIEQVLSREEREGGLAAKR